jgi:hypothetical protein
MASKRPEPDELPGLLTNVSYEVEVLAWSLHRATELEHGAESLRNYQVAIDRSAYVNSALVAARNLVYFFANDRWSKGAPIAGDFVAGWSAVPGGPVLGLVNHQVVHIGLNRVRNPQTTDFSELVNSIDSRLDAFFKQLEPNLQSRCHRSLAFALKAVVEPGKHR